MAATPMQTSLALFVNHCKSLHREATGVAERHLIFVHELNEALQTPLRHVSSRSLWQQVWSDRGTRWHASCSCSLIAL